MRYKNDFAMAATTARSYNRHWRAHKLTWTEIGKIKYLFDGAYDYMDDVTLTYTRVHFNKLRTALGFKQDSELTELIEKSDAFRIVRNKETHEIDAFMSPLVGDRFVPTPNQVIEEPVIPYEVFFCKANALANDNDRDKISENQYQHRDGINMHVLLAGNVPKFHVKASEEAYQRMNNCLWNIYTDADLHKLFYGEFEYAYMKKYNAKLEDTRMSLGLFLKDFLIDHMSRRVGIENWEADAIQKWIRNYFGAKQLPRVITQAHDNWLKYQPQPQLKI